MTDAKQRVKPTAQSLKAMRENPENIKVVSALFEAIAYCETVRDIIEPKQREILAAYQWTTEISKREPEEVVILDPKDIFRLKEDDFQIYLKEMQAFYKVSIQPSKEGNCPLLEAESLVRDTKARVCDFLAPFIGVNYDDIRVSLDAYKKYFDLILTMFAPHVKQYQTTKN